MIKHNAFNLNTPQSGPAGVSTRQGFVLMLVLALIVFGVTLLARFSQQSIGLASQAHRREREVQNRWAAWSLASTCVKSANTLLASAEDTVPQSRQNHRAIQVSLADQPWQIRINDLDTSINVNTINRLTNGAGASRLLAASKVPVIRRASTLQQKSQVIDSWGQVLNTSVMSPPQLAELQQICTCWNSGKLNIRFTTDQILQQAGRTLSRTGLFSRVIRERAGDENPTLRSIIQEAAISPEDTKLLNATLGDRSASFSVIVWNPRSGDAALQCILESGTGNFADRHSMFRYEQAPSRSTAAP